MENKSLQRHKYPTIVVVFAIVIAMMTVYSLFLLPKYVFASKNLKTAEEASEQSEYDRAAALYLEVLNEVPSSKRAKIGIALALFSNDNLEDDEVAVIALSDVTIYPSDWEKLVRVMPVEYQEYFVDVTQ